jgi:hypothetical protein
VTGAADVAARYRRVAKAFKPNGVSQFEIIQKGSDGTIGYWAGFQVARVQIGDMPARRSLANKRRRLLFSRQSVWRAGRARSTRLSSLHRRKELPPIAAVPPGPLHSASRCAGLVSRVLGTMAQVPFSLGDALRKRVWRAQPSVWFNRLWVQNQFRIRIFGLSYPMFRALGSRCLLRFPQLGA